MAAELLRHGGDERIAQLAQPRTDLWQQCAHIRVQEENAQLQECTFKPKTGRPPNRHRLAPGFPVEERLQLSQIGRQEALERARVAREREQLADCTFAPQLATETERHLRQDYTPLHKRVGQEQKRRTTKMAQAQLRRDLADADLTFQPQLNQRSLQLAAERETQQLFKQPAAARRPSSADFQERLRYYSLRKQLKRQAAAEAADAAACTFRPDTGNAVMERYERMAGEEAARMAARRAAKEAEVYGGMQFRPQLNPRSVALAPTGSGGVHGLASVADRQRQRLAELRQEEEERQRSQCTFQPDTSKPRVKGYYDEYHPPKAHAPISIAHAAKQGPVVVRGLERYLELKQLAERQKVEAEERAAKVFLTNPCGKQGTTVPQPFQLAGHALLEAKAAEKQAALLESTLCDHMRDCTFQPHTNTQRRQEQLQRILGQPSEELVATASQA
ncbi:hypothetical protein CHLNCDRAFT_52023 [Chlorella variabilis]|uniref:Uncharacterized protein n=1 Tax=Chlorella variabilis TaxID=554065 RepID=E1ZE42_CHLVA|nr:hypothetical protein CHLNCDRAFT_52023 [Chlorella variabilis]EFN55803.1 hypothetical protein CHLNCDRAFT_52023 [Chlorella variabilis]|eukprot:XP_005847905.1 hypothetical protein CHLNCDRAFT_52023 [Chlorella variabilis]